MRKSPLMATGLNFGPPVSAFPPLGGLEGCWSGSAYVSVRCK